MSWQALSGVSWILALASAACFACVSLHAYRRSVGTLVMVLLVPCYNVYYGFTQFEHRRRGWLLAGWLGGFVVAVSLQALAIKLATRTLTF